MTERISLTNRLKVYEEVFAVYFPYGRIEPMEYCNLPDRIKKGINGEGNCELSFSVIHQDLGQTFIAKDLEFETIHLQDRSKDDKNLGWGQVYLETGNENELPVVGRNFTLKAVRKQGLGTRRLFIMNALAHAVYDTAINSSESPSPRERLVWEKLVEQEFAEIHTWQGAQRYKFIS